MSSPTRAEDHSPPISAVPLPPFYFIVTFWGARYRKWFCRYALPSLLAPNNIPALRHLKECRFLICTTGKDWARLQREPIFALLKEYMTPVFVESPPSPVYEHKYARMSRGHEALTVACHQAQACAIYFAPDTLVPDGCVAEAQRLLVAGKRLVLCTAIRFDMDGVEAELASRGLLKPGLPLALSRRDAVDIGLRHLHPESIAGYWGAPNFGALCGTHGRTHFPVCCFWDVPGENGVVIHTHNWAPFMIDFSSLPVHDTQPFQRWAIDGDYIHRNFGTARVGETVYVVDDSDEAILLGLTPCTEMVPPRKSVPFHSVPVLSEWIKGYLVNQVVFDRYTDPLRRKIYSTCVRWHSRDVSPVWAEVEARAKKIMSVYTQHDLRPPCLIKSSRPVIDLLLSRQIFGLLSSVLVFWILLPPRRFIDHWFLRLCSYAHAIRWACKGDPVQQARIRNRVRLIVSIFSKSQ